MPFKLFHTHKSTKSKSNSSNGSDLCERKCEEPPDSDRKMHHKNLLHFFSNHKSSSHVHFKTNSDSSHKESKAKSDGSISHTFKTKSLTHLSSSGKESVHGNDSNSNDHRGTSGSNYRPRRAASYGTFMDNLSRERRLMEIAQLDSYMNYLRHTEDEGNMANRLCCAQVLKMSLLRLEQWHQISQERIDSCHKGSSSNSHSPSYSPNYCRQKLSHSKTAHEVDIKDHNGNVQTAFSSSSDTDSKENEHDFSSEPDYEDNCCVQEKLTTLKLVRKNGSTPVWPRDIEIF